MQNELSDLLDNKINVEKFLEYIILILQETKNDDSYYNKLLIYNNIISNNLINRDKKVLYYLKNNFGRDNIDNNNDNNSDISIISKFLLSYNPNFLLKINTSEFKQTIKIYIKIYFKEGWCKMVMKIIYYQIKNND